ncbi:reverse transcriptase domain-containing protein [Tanacetum coccineum]
MTTLVKKRNHTKFCEFHGKVRHNTDECMHLKKQIEEMLKAGKLSHLIKELKQNSGKEQPKAAKKGETSGRQSIRPGGANTNTGKDWRRRTLRFGLDEFRGYKVTISVQRNYRKTRSQKIASSSVNSSRNVEAHRKKLSDKRTGDKVFHKQIGRNLEVYVDDLVNQSRTEDEIVKDIEETFKTLREINMKLNPKKCTFGVEERMFLGYKVNTNGMKVCQDKAFKKMKQLIVELPMLAAPMEKEELILYLAATKETVSAVLMTERESKQMPIYFVSRALRGPEINYTSMEKLVLALVHASKRLKRYFQAHPIIVITNQPIQHVLSKPEVAGRLQKWSIELGEYAIHYRPRVSVKGQILADFIVERPEELLEPWILFTNGSSCTDGSWVGLILTNPEGMEFTYALRFRFDATNNEAEYEAEYEALIAGLRIAEQMGLKEKSIGEVEILALVEEEGDTWMTPVFEYLKSRPLQVNYVLREIHKGFCSMHAGTRSFVAKALSIGYYWPTRHKDARSLIRACQDYQIHKSVLRNPQQKLTLITSPWLFYKWGIDIAGSFPEGPGKVKFLILAIDYFTKWIEAKPVATITGNQIKKFVWENIVCRFGLPGEIISDNGKQFQDNPFKDWCEKLYIRQHFASVKHSQTNGLVERANRSLGEGIKARLDARSKNWMEELSHVLWAHRTPGDLVYRNNDASRAEDTGKLGPKWEGPYEVTEALGKGAYKLRDRDGKQLPQTWNVNNLKKM